MSQMWKGLESQFRGSAQTEGGKMNEAEAGEVLRLLSVIKQLWDWVGEQKDKADQESKQPAFFHPVGYAKARKSAYSNVRLYMRKFFAGLIDFDSKEQTHGKGLSKDV